MKQLVAAASAIASILTCRRIPFTDGCMPSGILCTSMPAVVGDGHLVPAMCRSRPTGVWPFPPRLRSLGSLTGRRLLPPTRPLATIPPSPTCLPAVCLRSDTARLGTRCGPAGKASRITSAGSLLPSNSPSTDAKGSMSRSRGRAAAAVRPLSRGTSPLSLMTAGARIGWLAPGSLKYDGSTGAVSPFVAEFSQWMGQCALKKAQKRDKPIQLFATLPTFVAPMTASAPL